MKNTVSENGSVSRGICDIDDKGNLANVVEHTKIIKENGKYISCLDNDEKVEFAADTVVSMNMWGFQDTIFDRLEALFIDFLKEKGGELKSEFYIPFVVDALVKANKCTARVLISESAWFGITYQDDKPEVQKNLAKLIADGIYPAKLFN